MFTEKYDPFFSGPSFLTPALYRTGAPVKVCMSRADAKVFRVAVGSIKTA